MSDLATHRLLAPDVPRGRAQRHQGLQLGRDACTRARSSFQPPLLFALTFIFLFSIGGLTGLMQGALAINVHIHDTYFIVGHFHYVMFGGTGFAFFAGAALLVPQDVRQDVQRDGRLRRLVPHVHRLQHALLLHAHPRHAGHAAPLLRSTCRSSTPCTWSPRSAAGSWCWASLDLLRRPDLRALQGPEGCGQPLGRRDAGVDRPHPAPAGELRDHPHRSPTAPTSSTAGGPR